MKAIKRAIILCWIMLIVCFIIKLFGGNWFEIICNNEHFINICSYIDAHAVVRHAISFPLYVGSTYFVICSCSLCPKPKFRQAIAIIVPTAVVWSTQFIHPYAKMVLEILLVCAMPFAIMAIEVGCGNWKSAIKKTWYWGIIGCALNLAFQIISMITKNVGIKIFDDNTLISLVLMIDYYIMIAIYYLYVRLKIKKREE